MWLTFGCLLFAFSNSLAMGMEAFNIKPENKLADASDFLNSAVDESSSTALSPAKPSEDGWLYWNAFRNNVMQKREIVQVYGIPLNKCRAIYQASVGRPKITSYSKYFCANEDSFFYRKFYSDNACQNEKSSAIEMTKITKTSYADYIATIQQNLPSFSYNYELLCTRSTALPLVFDASFAVNSSHNVFNDCLDDNVAEFIAYKEGKCFQSTATDEKSTFRTFSLPEIRVFNNSNTCASTHLIQTYSISQDKCRAPTIENNYGSSVDVDNEYSPPAADDDTEFDDDWLLGTSEDDYIVRDSNGTALSVVHPKQLFTKWQKVKIATTLAPTSSPNGNLRTPSFLPTSQPTYSEQKYSIDVKQNLIGITAETYTSTDAVTENNDLIMRKVIASLIGIKLKNIEIMSVIDESATNQTVQYSEYLNKQSNHTYYTNDGNNTDNIMSFSDRMLTPFSTTDMTNRTTDNNKTCTIINYKLIYTLCDIPPMYSATPDAAYRYINSTLHRTVSAGGFKATLRHYAALRSSTDLVEVSSDYIIVSNYTPYVEPERIKTTWITQNKTLVVSLVVFLVCCAPMYLVWKQQVPRWTKKTKIAPDVKNNNNSVSSGLLDHIVAAAIVPKPQADTTLSISILATKTSTEPTTLNTNVTTSSTDFPDQDSVAKINTNKQIKRLTARILIKLHENGDLAVDETDLYRLHGISLPLSRFIGPHYALPTVADFSVLLEDYITPRTYNDDKEYIVQKSEEQKLRESGLSLHSTEKERLEYALQRHAYQQHMLEQAEKQASIDKLYAYRRQKLWNIGHEPSDDEGDISDVDISQSNSIKNSNNINNISNSNNNTPRIYSSFSNDFAPNFNTQNNNNCNNNSNISNNNKKLRFKRSNDTFNYDNNSIDIALYNAFECGSNTSSENNYLSTNMCGYHISKPTDIEAGAAESQTTKYDHKIVDNTNNNNSNNNTLNNRNSIQTIC